MATSDQDAYFTLLTSDGYLPGAMVLAHSLRDNGTKKQLAALVTLDTLWASTIKELKTVYDHIIPVDRIVNRSPANLYLMNRPDLSSTFTKIALWRQTQFRKIVYVDADIVALQAPDELFARESSFAAVPDIGWPDCFNSGVLVLSPNMGDYYALLALAQRGISFDGADQGLLNMHFREWDRLSFTYNCTPSGNYQYLPAYRHFQSSINLVHFTGREKPWTAGRDNEGATGAYEDLLGRWWAVYERHYRAPTTAYISGQTQRGSRTVQQFVKGETISSGYGYSSIAPVSAEAPKIQVTPSTPEAPPSGQHAKSDVVEQGDITPTPTVEQRRFSAPQSEWNPIREPPPMNARPEAVNFPTKTYVMSADRNLFQAPKSYPEPPKDMWYQVPEAKPAGERPKPIFPWEENQAKPTRVFAEDVPTSPEPTPPIEMDVEETTEESQGELSSPTTPALNFTSPEPFASYSRTNAWDDVPEIERYVASLASSRKGRVQVLPSVTKTGEEASTEGADVEATPRRRPSMKLTDFPTEFERPSLPVTPAPMRRPSFWGEERDAAGGLPGAEGVPSQADWDPMAKLEELQRKQLAALAQGPASPDREIPDRKQPESAVLLPSSEESIVPPTSATGTRFQDLEFSSRDVADSKEDDGVFAPTG